MSETLRMALLGGRYALLLVVGREGDARARRAARLLLGSGALAALVVGLLSQSLLVFLVALVLYTLLPLTGACVAVALQVRKAEARYHTIFSRVRALRVVLEHARLISVEEEAGRVELVLTHSGARVRLLDADAREIDAPVPAHVNVKSPYRIRTVLSAGGAIDAKVAWMAGEEGEVELYGTLVEGGDQGVRIEMEQLTVDFESFSGSF